MLTYSYADHNFIYNGEKMNKTKRNNSWHNHMTKAKALLKIIFQRIFYDLRKCSPYVKFKKQVINLFNNA